MTTPKRKSQKHVTLQQIADCCGVSKGTVSLALRGHHSIGEATTARIVQAAKEMGYNPAIHDAARRLAAMRNHDRVINRVIALFFAPYTYSGHLGFFEEVFLGMMAGLREKEFAMLVEYLPQNERTPSQLLFESGNIDGVLMFGRGESYRVLTERLRNTPGFDDRPIVNYLTCQGTSWVNADEQTAAYTAARHLIELGHQHLMQCIYPRFDWLSEDSPAERIIGVRKALEDAGLDPAHHLHLQEIDSRWCNPNNFPNGVRIESLSFPEDTTRERLYATLHAHPEITGILAINDACAISLWHLLQPMGMRIPDDISLIGFDDTDPLLDASGKNILTTLRVPLFEIGRMSAHVVATQVLNPHQESPKILLPTEFIVRHSTAPANLKQLMHSSINV